MENYGELINNLIAEFTSLPGIGKKSAIRLAFHIVNKPKDDVNRFIKVLVDACNNIKKCEVCQSITDTNICKICSNIDRDKSIIMVVETTRDMMAYEKTNKYNGLYHVLNGVISPTMNMGPSDISLKELMIRLQSNDVTEVIIATNSTLEGEATAMYISQVLKGTGIKISRIASGVPVGGDIENIDEITLLRALEARIEL